MLGHRDETQSVRLSPLAFKRCDTSHSVAMHLLGKAFSRQEWCHMDTRQRGQRECTLAHFPLRHGVKKMQIIFRTTQRYDPLLMRVGMVEIFQLIHFEEIVGSSKIVKVCQNESSNGSQDDCAVLSINVLGAM